MLQIGMDNLKARIAAGVRSGALSPSDAAALTDKFQALAARIAGDNRDGRDVSEYSAGLAGISALSRDTFEFSHNLHA